MASPQVGFYRDAPQRRVALEELEQLGYKRVQLLSDINAQWLAHELLKTIPNELNDDEDLLSHYALRLAFCRTQNNWDWLVTAESKLFSSRLRCLPPYAAVALLAAEGIKYELLDLHKCKAISWDFSGSDKQQSLYRVPFTEVPALVKRRQVLVQRGYCLVPLRDMRFVAVHHFERCLEAQMRTMQCAIPAQGPELKRLAPMLDGFVEMANAMASTRGRASQNRPQLTVDNIDQVSSRHFPLCMQQLHRKLRENHHLKYDGRVQYRMFLKGAGISVHDCIQFFRKEFIKKISPTKFDKEYTYHIRHSYGLEGSRRDYTPLDCEQIINGSAPSHGQYHGCPFKHWGRPALQDELRRLGLSFQSAMEITQQAATGQCQHACKAFFKATHPASEEPDVTSLERGNPQGLSPAHSTAESIVMHPNAYLDAGVSSIDVN